MCDLQSFRFDTKAELQIFASEVEKLGNSATSEVFPAPKAGIRPPQKSLVVLSSAMPASAPDGIISTISVDVEEHFQVEVFASRVPIQTWPQLPSRVADNTTRVLELFARHQVRGTFFVVGWVAERHPQLLREIVAAGHEVGCHSHLHRALWRIDRDEFSDDTRRATAAIEDACGRKVLGYRAPTFSVVRRTLWAIKVLAEQGFLYDSSIFPTRHDLYGMPDAPRFPFQWLIDGSTTLYEVPMTTVRLLGRNLPAAGGGYLRILPFWYTRWAVQRVQQQDRHGAMVYFHPWEIDPGQPRIEAGLRSSFRHYTNLERMESRLARLLREFRFMPIEEMLRKELANRTLPCVPVGAMRLSEAVAVAAR